MKTKKIIVCTVMAANMLAFSACDVMSFFASEDSALREKYSAIYADVSEEMLKIGSGAGITATGMKESTTSTHVLSTSAFVYFISEVYKNNQFIITDKPVSFTCSCEGDPEEYSLSMYAGIDEESGKIQSEIFVSSTEMGQPNPSGYIYIEVGYDFSGETIRNFDLYMCDWLTGENVMRSVYDGEILYKLESVEDEAYMEAREKVLAEMEEFSVTLQSAVDLNCDFSAEYTASMQLLM